MPQEGKPHHQRSRHHIQECWIPSSCTGWSIGIPTLPAYPCRLVLLRLVLNPASRRSGQWSMCVCEFRADNSKVYGKKWIYLGEVSHRSRGPNMFCFLSHWYTSRRSHHSRVRSAMKFLYFTHLSHHQCKTFSLSSLNLYVKSHATQNSTFLEK